MTRQTYARPIDDEKETARAELEKLKEEKRTVEGKLASSICNSS
jgi:uncharacterized protein (DUF3084 family)